MGYHDMLGRAVRSRRGVERRRQNSGRGTHASMTQAKRRRVVVRKRVKDTKAGYPRSRPPSGIVKEGKTLRHDEYGNTIVEYPDGTVVVRKKVKDTKAGYPRSRPPSGIVKEGKTLRHDEYGNTIVEYPDGTVVVRKKVKDTKAGYPRSRPPSGIVKEGKTLRHDEYGNTIVEYPDGRREVIVGHPKPMEVVTDLKSWLGGGLEPRRLGISLHGTLEKAISLKESILGNMSKRRRRWW